MGCALALIALGTGYLVLLNANKEKEGLKLLGQVIAILIIVGSVASALCSSMKCGKGGYGLAKGGMCPVSVKSAEAPAQS
jgi:hypothetical protein